MEPVIFTVAFLASTCGAIAGFGGGVIIKPILDALGILPVSSVSFLSGCTALGMAAAFLIRQRNDGVRLHLKTSTPLAIGAAIGGVIGKSLFELVRNTFQNESTLGAIQSVCLTLITLGVFVYICKKDRLRSFHVADPVACVAIGSLLGVISSFLGIGGGTSNIMILFLCFSMDAKTAAKNSLYIIVFSQSTSILQAMVTQTVPDFAPLHLVLMVSGGIAGAVIGGAISKHISNRRVEWLLRIMLAVIILIDASNVVKFLS